MAGGSPKHNAICASVARAIGNRLAGGRCLVFGSDHYWSIDSLEEYVLVAQDGPRVEHYRRIEPRQWLLTELVGGDAALVLTALACEVPLRELYAGVELLEESDAAS